MPAQANNVADRDMDKCPLCSSVFGQMCLVNKAIIKRPNLSIAMLQSRLRPVDLIDAPDGNWHSNRYRLA